MLDIDEAKGQSSCDELRREFSDESVTFIQCDVCSEQMLVISTLSLLLPDEAIPNCFSGHPVKNLESVY